MTTQKNGSMENFNFLEISKLTPSSLQNNINQKLYIFLIVKMIPDSRESIDTGTESSTTVFQEHVHCRCAYKMVSIVDPDFSRPLVMYRDEDAAEVFVRRLQLEAQQLCDEYISTPKPPIFTMEDTLSFTNATTCHICTTPLGEDKVSDHCHITGNYRGAAHEECEITY